MFDDLGRAPMDVHPREGFAEDAALGKLLLGTRARGQITQPPLETDDQAETLDVATRERQIAQTRKGWPLGRPTGISPRCDHSLHAV